MNIAVIGSGIAGITAARRLEQLLPNIKVDLYDEQPRLGGKTYTHSSEIGLIENGPDSLNAHKKETHEMLMDLNLESEVITPRINHFTLIDENFNDHQIPFSIFNATIKNSLNILRLPFVSFKGKIIWIYKVLLSKFNKNDTSAKTVFDYLIERYGEEMAKVLYSPLYSGVYGGDAKSLSSRCMSWNRVSSPWKSQFISLSSGLGLIIEKSKSLIKATSYSPEKVIQISNHSDAPSVSVTACNGTKIYQGVICAVPSKCAAKLFENSDQALRDLFNKLPKHSAGCLTFKTDCTGLEKFGSGAIFANKEQGITGVTFSSVKWENRSKCDSHLVRVFIANKLLDADPEIRLNACVKMLNKFGIHNPELIFEKIWKEELPIYTNESFELISKIRTHEGRIQFAGASFDGPGVTDAYASGIKAAERLYNYLTSRK